MRSFFASGRSLRQRKVRLKLSPTTTITRTQNVETKATRKASLKLKQISSTNFREEYIDSTMQQVKAPGLDVVPESCDNFNKSKCIISEQSSFYMGHSRPLFVYFRSLQTQILDKNCRIQWDLISYLWRRRQAKCRVVTLL